MKRIVIILFLLITTLITLLTIPACKKNKVDNVSTSVPVEVKSVIQKDVPVYIDSFGILAASQDVDICPMISGKIEKIFFQNGSYVKKGQKLFQIDPQPYKARLLRDKALLNEDLAGYSLKNILYNRDRKLVSSHAISKTDYDKAFADFSMAAATLKGAKADILLDDINLEYCVLRSPISGILGLKKIDAGNVVGTNSVLANIKAIDTLYLNFTVSERDIARIEKFIQAGPLSLNVSVDEKTNYGIIQEKHYQGEIKYLNNTANSTSGTISLQGIVPNKNHELLPGQFARIKLLLETEKNALLVPKAAVREGPDGQYVFIVDKDNKARMVPITTAPQSYGDFFMIINGKLKPDEKVVITGFLNLTPGKFVNVTRTI